MISPTPRWTGRTDPLIVEVAEALGCSTELVAAVGKDVPGLPPVVATFTPDYPDDEAVYGARLERDADGILREIGRVRLGDSLIEFLNREED